jgi:quercetin dioxygenase-like cupin family protein
MKHTLSNIAPREIMNGFSGKLIHTDAMTFAYWTIEAGAVLPAHQHPHEQVVNMLSGSFELTAGNETVTLTAGDIYAIPGNTTHSGRAITSAHILDVFHPVREDYRTSK